MLLTFGLLSPNKGIEYVLERAAGDPRGISGRGLHRAGRDASESVAGTGRGLPARPGAAGRRPNRVQKNVIFYNRFVELEELKEFIGAADIYITPYLNEAQITSGTLAYAFGAGKAVVSTPYWHAAELLADERGMLVPFGDARGHRARGRSACCATKRAVHAMRKNAYKLGREMIWSNVARLYMRAFRAGPRWSAERAAAKIFRHQDPRPATGRELPEMKLDHLSRMTRFHRACFSTPSSRAQFFRGILHG